MNDNACHHCTTESFRLIPNTATGEREILHILFKFYTSCISPHFGGVHSSDMVFSVGAFKTSPRIFLWVFLDISSPQKDAFLVDMRPPHTYLSGSQPIFHAKPRPLSSIKNVKKTACVHTCVWSLRYSPVVDWSLLLSNPYELHFPGRLGESRNVLKKVLASHHRIENCTFNTEMHPSSWRGIHGIMEAFSHGLQSPRCFLLRECRVRGVHWVTRPDALSNAVHSTCVRALTMGSHGCLCRLSAGEGGSVAFPTLKKNTFHY